MRFIAGLLGIVAIAAAAWLLRLPDRAECVASGRVVDPTERHCESSGGYQQLQEHAFFHASQVLAGAAALLAVGYTVHRYRRRRSPGAMPSKRDDR